MVSGVHQLVKDHVRKEASGHVETLRNFGEVISPEVSELLTLDRMLHRQSDNDIPSWLGWQTRGLRPWRQSIAQ